MSRTLPPTIVAEFATETPALSYYAELTRSDGTTYAFAVFEVNWSTSGAATLGFVFTEPIVWSGSSTQTCKVAIPRAVSLSALGVDIGELALANVLRNGELKIWLRGGLDAELGAALAAGKLQPWFVGRVVGCETAPDFVEITASTEFQAEGMTPNRRVMAAQFKHLPAPGTTRPYNGGVVQLGAEP